MVLAHPCPPPATGYMCVESPVDWFAIDVLAIVTVIWIIFTFFYKGVRQARVMRYPQINIMIPYNQWEKVLTMEKPRMGIGRIIKAFLRTLFIDVLAMEILMCKYGESEGELVRTRIPKRVAKLLIVWGFILAGLSTVLAYLEFPYNMIVLNLTTPARISGMTAGVLLILGSSIWLSVRYKEVNYRGIWDFLGADYLPVMVLLLAVSGFMLQAAIWVWAYSSGGLLPYTFLIVAIHFHAIVVAAFFWLFFWTKADHIVYRIFWRVYDYVDREIAGASYRLPSTTIKVMNRTGKDIQGGVVRSKMKSKK